jgi:hypothetical protein
MYEQTACNNALTRIALGHVAQSHHLQHGTLKRGKPHKQHTKSCRQSTGNQTAAAAKSAQNPPFICYNCNELGHIAPNCPHSKRKHQQANSAQGAADTNKIACLATMRNTQEEKEAQVTQEVSNMYSHQDHTLTMFVFLSGSRTS